MALFGLLNVHKPSGVTSRRVVNQVQRLVKPDKVGHAGTLDPLAAGVLILGIGHATRLVEYVQELPKTYRATFLLGRTSDTEDIEGQVTLLPNANQPSLDALQAAAVRLTGEIVQRPPAYSALKVSGQRAYALARTGQDVELAPRKVNIHRLDIVGYEYPELHVDVECSSGTYIRSLGRDLAEQLGTGAVMSALVRHSIGQFTIDTAIDPQNLNREQIASALLPATAAIDGLMPLVAIASDDIRRISNGLSIALAVPASHARCAVVDETNRLVSILKRRDEHTFTPEKYFSA